MGFQVLDGEYPMGSSRWHVETVILRPYQRIMMTTFVYFGRLGIDGTRIDTNTSLFSYFLREIDERE